MRRCLFSLLGILLPMLLFAQNSSGQNSKSVFEQKIDEEYTLVYMKYDSNFNFYYDPYIRYKEKLHKIRGVYETAYSTGFVNISPNKKFVIIDAIVANFNPLDNGDSVYYEKYTCKLIRLDNYKLIDTWQSACGGEWNELSQFVFGGDIIFDPEDYEYGN